MAISSVPLSFWEFGTTYQLIGDYWGKPCRDNGRLEFITVGHAGQQATLLMSGTDNPDLFKWSETSIGYTPEVIAHLCPAGCPKHPISTGAFHATEVGKEDTGAVWAGNVGPLATPVPGGVGNLEKELAMVAGDLKPPGVPKEPVQAEEVPASKQNVKELRWTPLTQ